ncbi:stalk domain-containing protein [Paenibacillus sp. GYB004]|uniref:stalk domain-containing protein n=1 Tax=Paenibacillus sp. GYB004 TaxID=2994393 RepID=UPI002F96DB07
MGKYSAKAVMWLSTLILVLACTASFAMAKEDEVAVYFNGELLTFADQQPVIQNGTTLVPFRAIFEALSYEVEWNGEERKAIGIRKGLKIELTIDSLTAKVNGQAAELSVPPQIINNHTMIPLRFVSENSGYDVIYSQESGTIVIRIGTGMPAGNTAGETGGQAEPYVVKGKVVNPQGEPIKGALITIDNQLLYNSNSQIKTDANGQYRIELTKMAATYKAYAEYSIMYEGVKHSVDLIPDDDSPFAGNEGAVRNFTVKLDSSTGTGGSAEVLFYMMDLIHPLNPVAEPPNRDDVTLTLEPEGKMLDGTSGKKIVSKGSRSNNGYGVHNVPIGKYKVSAVYAPPGAEPQHMLIRVVNPGQDDPFHPSVVAGFQRVTDKIYKMELELKLDVVKPPAEDPSEIDWDAVYDINGNRIDQNKEWNW